MLSDWTKDISQSIIKEKKKRKGMVREMKNSIREALVKSLPIFFSYICVAFGYGLLMQKSGFAWYYALFTSFIIYTGAFQFVLITFLKSGASIVTIALTAFLMNSRQSFYSLTFLQDFKAMGTAKWYMIHTMTDETYAVNCTLSPEVTNRRQVMFFVALFSRIYWMAGTILGGLFGQLLGQIPDGIDFCMTALFVIIFMDQWEKAKSHIPALIGLGTGIICLLFFGKSNFILLALIIASGILLLWQRKEKKEVHDEKTY